MPTPNPEYTPALKGRKTGDPRSCGRDARAPRRIPPTSRWNGLTPTRFASVPGLESGGCFAETSSLWPEGFPPSPPPPLAGRPCSETSRVLPFRPTSLARSSSAYAFRLPDTAPFAQDRQGISRFSRALFPCMPWAYDPAESLRVLPFRHGWCGLPHLLRASALRSKRNEAQYHACTFLFQRFTADLADRRA